MLGYVTKNPFFFKCVSIASPFNLFFKQDCWSLISSFHGMLQIILVGGQNQAKRSNCILSTLKRKAEVFKFSLVSLIKSVWTRHGLQKILVIRSQIIYFLLIYLFRCICWSIWLFIHWSITDLFILGLSGSWESQSLYLFARWDAKKQASLE